MKLDLNQALEQLAQAFNTTVDKLYPMLIKQAYVSGISSLVVIMISWLVLGVAIYFFKKHGIKKDSYLDILSDGTIGLMIFTVITALAAIFITMAAGSNAMTALINPEYWALKEILSYIK